MGTVLVTGCGPIGLMALATLVAAVGAWIGTRFMASTYASSTTIMVGRGLDNPDVSAQTIYLSNQLATTYSQMASREPVMRGVVDKLKLPISWQQLIRIDALHSVAAVLSLQDRTKEASTELERALSAAGALALALRKADSSAREGIKDPETSAYTFAYFVDVAGREIERARRYDRRFGLLTFTIDNHAELVASAPKRPVSGNST